LKMNRMIEDLVASFATVEGVEAFVLAGSITSGLADEGSDYDLHAYTREAVPLEFRARMLKPRAARLELHNTFFEWSDEWIEPTVPSSISCPARATSSRPPGPAQSDPLPRPAGGGDHPEEPAAAGGHHPPYEQQIHSAFRRRDHVSLNHRTAAWLASYFDILFAANRRLNPGEKRLLVQVQALPTVPEGVAADAEGACTGACSLDRCVAEHLERMRTRLERVLRIQGLL
jgi:hypothetical protein